MKKRRLEFMAIDIKDEFDSDLVLIDATLNDIDEENLTEGQKMANTIIDHSAGFFTDLSLVLKKLMVNLPPEAIGWFPEIAGGALFAQLEVIRDSIFDDKEGTNTINSIGSGLAEKAIAALTRKRNRS